MAKRLIVNPEKCTGCNSCMLECSFVHEGYFSLAKSRIQIDRDETKAEFNPRVCIQCSKAFCVESCPTNAISQDPIQKVIQYNADKCIHCHLCEAACPFGGIRFDNDTGYLQVCDLCGGHPACVDVCRLPQAIKYE